MKSSIFKISMVWIFSLSFVDLPAQAIVNDAGEREKHFIYEVKQIDEFFERFNDDSNSFVRKVYATYHVRYNLNRAKLIKSLFNYETKSWSADEIDRFVNTATNPKHPVKLDFYSNNWYAEARCKFQQNEEVIDVALILRIETDSLKRSKWIIVGVRSGSLKPNSEVAVRVPQNNEGKFINPASHANNFIELDKAFDDKDNLSDYFDVSFFKRSYSAGFYKAIANNDIKFLYVKDV
ncbi:MAG TPA: hypothetical protein VFE04_06110, partial [Puia sp.]|nr:hypothetical protein [Puia sp.]